MGQQKFVIGALAAFWLGVLLFVFETKSRAGYIGLPIIAVVFVGYLIWVSIKGVKSTNEKTKTDTKKENE